MKRHSQENIKRLKSLRRRGFSINELVDKLSIPKTTVWNHIHDVTVLPKYAAVLKSRRGGSAKRASKRRAAARLKAKSFLASTNTRDALMITSCLYWGEGTKKEFGFLNTDPRLIETFLSCLSVLGISKSRLKVGIRIYEDIDELTAKHYWARVTRISVNKITSVEMLPGKKIGKTKYGMCRIRLANSNDCFNLMMATIEILSEKYAPVAQRIRASDS